MAKLLFHVTIIFLMIVGCIGPRHPNPAESKEMSRRLLNIFYGTYPPDEHHLKRVKAEWDRQLPHHSQETVQKLDRRIYDLTHKYWKKWLNRSIAEREQMESILIAIYFATNDGEPHHEERMLKELFEIRPDYLRDYEMMRTVVYRWYRLYTPLGKEISAKDVDWTPQRKADLLHIAEKVKGGQGNQRDRIKSLWIRMYKHLNVSAESLAKYAYSLEKKIYYEPGMQEKLEAEQKYKSLLASKTHAIDYEEFSQKGKKIKWNDQMNADLMYIDGMIRQVKGVCLTDGMKDRWDRMQKKFTHFSGEILLARVNRLYKYGYKPRPEYLQDSKERYEALPPIPTEVFFKRTGKRKSKQVQIREEREPIQQHQDFTASPSFELTPEALMWLHQEMEGNDISHTGYALYPSQTQYYGSSSHTPTDQASSTQSYIPNLYDHQWYPGSWNSYSQHPPQ